MADPSFDPLAALKAIAAGQAPGAGTGPSASNALGGNYTAGKTPMVYWGQQSASIQKNTSGRDSSRDEVIARLGIQNRPGDSTKTLQDGVADWYTWSDQERAAFGKRLYGLGLVHDPNDYGAVFTQWQNAVQEASNFYSFGQKKVTPWQVLDVMAGTNGGPKPTTHVEKNFSIPTVEDAHAAAKTVTQALLGRDPDKDELDRLASIMTGYAQAHPKITKVVTDIHGNNTTTNSGGVSDAALGDVLSNQVKADPEYASFTAAVPLWNRLMQEVGTMARG